MIKLAWNLIELELQHHIEDSNKNNFSIDMYNPNPTGKRNKSLMSISSQTTINGN